MPDKGQVSGSTGNTMPVLESRIKTAAICVLLVICACYLSITAYRILHDPEVVFLLPEDGASWIIHRSDPELRPRPFREVAHGFRTIFNVREPSADAVLTVRGLESILAVYLDGNQILPQPTDPGRWKEETRLDLSGMLPPGEHYLMILASNRKGPVAIQARCEEVDLTTDSSWSASLDSKNWTPAAPVQAKTYPVFTRPFPHVGKAFLGKLHFFLPVFLVVFFWTLIRGRTGRPIPWFGRVEFSTSKVRWFLVSAWTILAVNNIGKIPSYLGFDRQAHMAYIQYIVENHRLPLANEGWQTVQPPLYYVLSAPVYAFFSKLVDMSSLNMVLRVVPLLCGLALIEICYRTLRLVFPEREDLQKIGLVIGGLLPMNLYIGQTVGNEPLAACLSGAALLFTFRFLALYPGPQSGSSAVLIGLFLGLSLLTKVTAIILFAPIALVTGAAVLSAKPFNGSPSRELARTYAIIIGTAFIVSGWYYLRNWIVLGSPYIDGTDPSRGLQWWQHHGFRIVEHFTRFGRALTYPVLSALDGFWDAFYSSFWMDGYLTSTTKYAARPPWNYGFMLSGAWLALLPTAAILLGSLAPLRRRVSGNRLSLVLASLCFFSFLAALLHYYLMVPFYGMVKASYTSGLTACYAVLAAAGFSLLLWNSFMRALVYGIVACWASASYVSYFVR